MENKVELNLYFGDVRNVMAIAVRESDLQTVLGQLRTGQGIVESLTGLEVRASEVTAFEVVR